MFDLEFLFFLSSLIKSDRRKVRRVFKELPIGARNRSSERKIEDKPSLPWLFIHPSRGADCVKGTFKGTRERIKNGDAVNNISVPFRLSSARETLKLRHVAPPLVHPPHETEIIKLESRGRAKVLFPLCQKERKTKLQRVKRAHARMSGATMIDKAMLFLIFATIVSLSSNQC